MKSLPLSELLLQLLSLFGSKLGFCRVSNIGNTLVRVSTVFMRSAIIPPIVNRFGWNLEHSEYIVWGWLWQTLSAICAEARERQSARRQSSVTCAKMAEPLNTIVFARWRLCAIMGRHIAAIWRIRLNYASTVEMRNMSNYFVHLLSLDTPT